MNILKLFGDDNDKFYNTALIVIIFHTLAQNCLNEGFIEDVDRT